ncbi:hypothetical protein GDO78_017583 [Eleutherodactylus coqui]|uniref:Uncharacterized protein n=1 Tax=Eleutherodactylus coqui TaxID=57060 RepID=A0A8J6JV79_ELECQ|nr:hypothetical protein GDO78_017583 [Eleutherodactylus coqui]
MKNRELDLLAPAAALDSSRTFPVLEEPPATKDVGISDVENCNLNSEPPQKETPQDNEDQIADGSAVTFPPPENIPMLP